MTTISLLKDFNTALFWADRDGDPTTQTSDTFVFPQQVARWAHLFGDFDYNGGDDPIGNSYTLIEVFDDAGLTDLVATLTSTTPITFTNFFTSELQALAGDDTLTGSNQNDIVTLHGGADNADGKDGSDIYRFNNGDVAAGEIVNDTGTGVGDFDALFVVGNNVDFRLATTLAGLEGITYDAGAGAATAIFNGSQFGGAQLPDDLTITGRTGEVDNLHITDVTNLDAVAWALNNWGAEDVIRIEGTAGADTITATSAADTIFPGGGADNINAGGGPDVIAFFSAGVAVGLALNGGPGTDQISIAGNNVDLRPATTLSNLEGISFDAAAGASTAIFNSAQFGVGGQLPANVTITGRPGLQDIIDVRVANVLNSQFFQFVDWDNQDLIVFEGTSGFNDITGTSQNDRINAGAGFDLVNAGNGNDIIQISGTQAQTDFMGGGNGTDAIQVLGGGPVTINFFNATNSSIERWTGNNNGVLGTSAANDFNFSFLQQKTGLKFFDLGSGNDNFIGTKFADDARGGKGNDNLNGGAGKDKLTGGANKDTMTGGADKDTFDFNSIKDSGKGSKADRITDLKKGDKIDLRDVYSGKLKFIKKDDFNDKKGEVRYEDKGKKVVVQVDKNGDGKSDMDINVDIGSINATYFFL